MLISRKSNNVSEEKRNRAREYLENLQFIFTDENLKVIEDEEIEEDEASKILTNEKNVAGNEPVKQSGIKRRNRKVV